jgi:hypothetical protein
MVRSWLTLINLENLKLGVQLDLASRLPIPMILPPTVLCKSMLDLLPQPDAVSVACIGKRRVNWRKIRIFYPESFVVFHQSFTYSGPDPDLDPVVMWTDVNESL